MTCFGQTRIGVINHLGATKLLTKDQLQLRGALPMTATTGSDVTAGLDPPSYRPLAIRVDGVSKDTTRESLSNYFGDRNLSGGGVIEELEYDNDAGVDVITYENAESE